MTTQDVLVVGGDFSTDGVKAAVFSTTDPKPVAEVSFSLFKVFGSKYGLKENAGFIEREGGAVRIPYGLVFEGMDHLMTLLDGELREKGFETTQVKRILISFQQHGMVAWATGSGEKFAALGSNPKKALIEGVEGLFSTDSATSWRDTTSKAWCQSLQKRLCPASWAEISGSAPMASLRFLGAQTGRLSQELPKTWSATEKFTVLASLGTSLLTGKVQEIGLDEASMTLLMDLKTGEWSNELLQHFQRGLVPRLPKIVPAGSDSGKLWQYWVDRKGFSPDCIVHMGFGDNPAADLTADGMKLSLGSSGVLYQDLPSATYDPTFACHVLRNAKGGFMGMYCMECGKFADERRLLSDLSWPEFDDCLTKPQWEEPGEFIFQKEGRLVAPVLSSTDVPAAITRGILLDIKTHSGFMGTPPSITLTGGFGKKPVAQMVADIWGCPVSITPKVNRVVYGSAIWGLHEETGEDLIVIANRLCPKGEQILPDASRAAFYKRAEEEFRRQFA